MRDPKKSGSKEEWSTAKILVLMVVCMMLGSFIGSLVSNGVLTVFGADMNRLEAEKRWEVRLLEANQALEEARIEARTEEARAKGKAWVKAQETLAEADAIVARARAHKEAAVTLEPYLSHTFLLYRQVEQGCGVELTPQIVVKGE